MLTTAKRYPITPGDKISRTYLSLMDNYNKIGCHPQPLNEMYIVSGNLSFGQEPVDIFRV